MYNKFPRTPHLPYSPGMTRDDLMFTGSFLDKEVVITEKMDGENTTIYSDGYCHARSIDSNHHASRSFMKHVAALIGYKLPDGWRVCGENLYAKHSIAYTELESFFMVFAIIDHNNTVLSWNDTVAWCGGLELITVPIIRRGIWQFTPDIMLPDSEGYVVRVTNSFSVSEYDQHVAKWVRPNHVQTDTHWTQNWTPNKLKGK